jgi:hypothetical protein
MSTIDSKTVRDLFLGFQETMDWAFKEQTKGVIPHITDTELRISGRTLDEMTLKQIEKERLRDKPGPQISLPIEWEGLF